MKFFLISLLPLLAVGSLASAGSAAVMDRVTIPARTSPATTTWRWRGPPRVAGVLRVDGARGEVRVERSRSGMVEVDASIPSSADGSPASLVVEAEGGRLRLIDVYPASPAWAAECLPPNGEHGGFLRYADRPAIVIRVPAAVRVAGRAMDGGPLDAAARR